MDKPEDFGDAVVFRASPIQNFAILILFLFMLAGAPYLLLFSSSIYSQALGAVGIPISLWLVLRAAANVCRGRQVMVAIGERGVFDWRISDVWIPWRAILNISLAAPVPVVGWQRYGIAIQVDPPLLSTFKEKTISRAMHTRNAWCGLPGFTVTLLGVSAKFAQVATALDRYFPQWREPRKESTAR
ncbi:MAG TPA: hypothetical protein VFL53_01555 [Pseudolabrys sp.]|nr:hypothetical protein [Pseudolabrys sp.]